MASELTLIVLRLVAGCSCLAPVALAAALEGQPVNVLVAAAVVLAMFGGVLLALRSLGGLLAAARAERWRELRLCRKCGYPARKFCPECGGA